MSQSPQIPSPAIRRLLAWRWSVVGSIVIHGVIIGGSLYLSIAPSSPEKAPLSALPPFAGQILADQRNIASAMSPSQRRRTIEEKLPELDRIKSSDVKAITKLIESAESLGGGSPRATEPRPGVAGEFDLDSAMVYDILRKPGKSGAVTEWTMVDREGRTMKFERRESELSDEERNLARMCEMARHSPNLKMLFDSARRIAGISLERARTGR